MQNSKISLSCKISIFESNKTVCVPFLVLLSNNFNVFNLPVNTKYIQKLWNRVNYSLTVLSMNFADWNVVFGYKDF